MCHLWLQSCTAGRGEGGGREREGGGREGGKEEGREGGRGRDGGGREGEE